MANEEYRNSKVYTIKGATRDDCMRQLFDKYGTGFRPLSHQTHLKNGFLGFFQGSFVELRYQVLNDTIEPPQQAPVARTSYSSSGYSSFRGMDSNRMTSSGGLPSFSQEAFQSQSGSSASDFMKNRDEMLKKTDSTLTNTIQMAQIAKQFEQFQKDVQEKMDTIVRSTSAEESHKNIDRIVEILEENEFKNSYIKMICSRLKNEFSLDELDDFDLVQRKVLLWIGESIPVEQDYNSKNSIVTILVGPTGVGKTTTVAKMGSRIAIDYKKNENNREKYPFPPRIRMITTDTMRVAAMEQLSRWAEIINVQVDKAENSDDLRVLCERYASNSDYIFVDTSGYSPNDYENIARMRKILDVKNLNETIYLTVVAGVSARDLENIIRNYEAFNFRSVILTKCDETNAFGRVISVLSEHKKPISWVTTGQEVLNTIERATPYWFIKNLSGFKVDLQYFEKVFSKNTDNQ